MARPSRWKSAYERLRWPEKLGLILLAMLLILYFGSPGSSYILPVWILLTGAVSVSAVRVARAGIRRLIWGVRNRLLVTYLFIAVVPILLILAMAGTAVYLCVGQVAVYLITNELDRRAASLAAPARGLMEGPGQRRAERLRWLASQIEQHYPGVEILIGGQEEWRYPETSTLDFPPAGWTDSNGVLQRDRGLYLWTYSSRAGARVLMTVPLTRDFLAGLVRNLGDVEFADVEVSPSGAVHVTRVRRPTGSREHLPAAVNRFDIPVTWFTLMPVARWESPGLEATQALGVTTRFSSVFRVLFEQKLSIGEEVWWSILILAVVLFAATELASLIIGGSMTRTVTLAVHNLYEGTRRVMEGDFSHRIDVRGHDQLAQLSHSFDRMTANIERLVRVEKEKERMQSELEIAREVQNQLYPKIVPSLPSLELTALCHAARTVSGDYYDYMKLQESKLALAIGDVAGKGISAALLMATVQASLRTQIRACLEHAERQGQEDDGGVLSARLVSQLNQQLYAYTSPEKYATFYFGIYDDATSLLTYTNAGHPPPILIRNGEAQCLETNGMVVGAFPFAEYGESRIALQSGDLLVCFTDGVTEPENEYGEMFGEQGLTDVLLKNAWRKPGDIIDAILSAVGEWTHSPEPQDDMTLLLARRV